MHSSQNEQDSRHYAKAAKIPMLEPSDSGECRDFTKLAFSLSEEYDTPVFIRLSTRVSHSQSLVELHEPENIELKPYVKNIAKNVMMPANAIGRHVVVEERSRKLAEFAETCELNIVEDNGSRIGVITSGVSYVYSKDALGDKVNYLKLGMVYPLPEKLIKDFAASVDTLYVVEELDGFIEEFVRSLGIEVRGKDHFTLLGEYSQNMIAKVVLGEETAAAEPLPLPKRPPVMCAAAPTEARSMCSQSSGSPYRAISAAIPSAQSHRSRALIPLSAWVPPSAPPTAWSRLEAAISQSSSSPLSAIRPLSIRA